ALMKMETAGSLEEALTIAPGAGLPGQNLVVADRRGGIAWTVMGRLPRRIGFAGRRPTSWADGRRRWAGWLPASEYPRVLRPAEVLGSLTAPCRRADRRFRTAHLASDVEESVWQLVTRRPAHLLPPGHSSWEGLLQAVIDRVAGEVQGGQPSFEEALASYTWG